MKICKVLSFEVQKQALIAGVRQGEMVPRRVFAASSRPRDLLSVKCPPSIEFDVRR